MIRVRVSAVDEGGDLPVEVRGEPVADVRLDEPLGPVPRRGLRVEAVDRLLERGHRLVGVGAELGEPGAQPVEVAELP